MGSWPLHAFIGPPMETEILVLYSFCRVGVKQQPPWCSPQVLFQSAHHLGSTQVLSIFPRCCPVSLSSHVQLSSELSALSVLALGSLCGVSVLCFAEHSTMPEPVGEKVPSGSLRCCILVLERPLGTGLGKR